ncbi:holin family protein [Tenacibaculum phage Larrie]|nr:holin family protein [Tenacibaculum phage Larrie]
MDRFENYLEQFFKLFAYVIFVYLGIDKEAFGILIVFMCIDSVLGAIKAVQLGEKFSFKILLWGFCLKLCILIVPLIVSLLGKAMKYDFSVTVNIVICVLLISESYSIIGNIYMAKYKKVLDKVDIVSMLLKSLRNFISSMAIKFLSGIEQKGNCEVTDKNFKHEKP